VLFQSLIELLQPGALVGIMNLLPPILTGLAIMEGCISFSKNQFRSFDRYFTFQVINVFLVTTIAGSVIDCLKDIYEVHTHAPRNPTSHHIMPASFLRPPLTPRPLLPPLPLSTLSPPLRRHFIH